MISRLHIHSWVTTNGALRAFLIDRSNHGKSKRKLSRSARDYGKLREYQNSGRKRRGKVCASWKEIESRVSWENDVEKRWRGWTGKETSGRGKRGLKWLQLRGFLVVQVAVKNSWKVNHFLRPSPVVLRRAGGPEVFLMLRYFTRKLFKSNILLAVIKYKLHRGEIHPLNILSVSETVLHWHFSR